MFFNLPPSSTPPYPNNLKYLKSHIISNHEILNLAFCPVVSQGGGGGWLPHEITRWLSSRLEADFSPN